MPTIPNNLQKQTLTEFLMEICKESERLKAENEKLKEAVETRDNLVEHFRKEAINWAKISNGCIKDIENYKQTLQEIKAIAEECTTCGDCSNCKYCEDCDTDL